MQESAFLLKELTIDIEDIPDDKRVTYHYDNGLISFVDYINEDKEVLHKVIPIHGVKNTIEVDIAMQYTDSYNENIISFVNNVKTSDGGTHEVGFKSAITRAFNDHARLIGALKDKDINLDGADIREGLTAIISIRVPEDLLQFEGQTKNKLGTPEAKPAVEQVVYDQMKAYLAENGQISANLINKAIRASKAREASHALFAGGGDSAHMPTVELSSADFADGDMDILSLLVKTELAPSRSDARRAVEQGGVSVADEKVTDIKTAYNADSFGADGLVVKRGKKKFVKVIVK